VNTQNQGQPTSQNFTAQNVMAANAKYQQEAAGELAQSPGQISQFLLARSKAGFEFGNMGGNMAAKNANNANANAKYEFGNMASNANLANANLNQNSELNQSNGQVSRILAQQSR
jgi:hypothetical protein